MINNPNLVVVVVLGFYVPPTAKVIRRQNLSLKSHPTDWRSPGSISRPLVYKASSLTNTMEASNSSLDLVNINVYLVKFCQFVLKIFRGNKILTSIKAWWPSGKASDSRARGQGFDPHSGRRVVSLSKIHLPPKSTGNTQEAAAQFQHD